MNLLNSKALDFLSYPASVRGWTTRPGAFAAVLVPMVLTLAGCANLSGLGGSSEFQCKAPPGVPCMSISGVHANDRAGNLPAQRNPTGLGEAAREGSQPGRNLDTAATTATAPGIVGEGGAETYAGPSVPSSKSPVRTPYKGTGFSPTRMAGASPATLNTAAAPLGAIRSDPTVIRLWIAPWEDADGDLNDQGFVYLQIDSGRWLIEHNRAQIRREFAPQRLPLVSLVPAGPGGRAGADVLATAGAAVVSAVQGAAGTLTRLVPALSGDGISKADAELLGRAMTKGGLRGGAAAAAAAAPATAMSPSDSSGKPPVEVRP